eukprot:TRINITY_DN17284_c0_g1_i6.p1 TRINITY_DN17284_c0_g1~~TRINITY_DN17284_c0_g1_i6.p1  ORF type:complete len:800 (-),score=259.20 TRINITY_DN17284_c0_g1_i6:145-2544(-)
MNTDEDDSRKITSDQSAQVSADVQDSVASEKTTTSDLPSGSEFKMPSMPPPTLPPVPKQKLDSVKTQAEANVKEKDSTIVKSEAAVPNTESTDDKLAQRKSDSEINKSNKSPAELAQAKSIPLAYQEPTWGGLSTSKYSVEVLKNGTIIDTIELKDKSFFVIGRLATCDIVMEHPSLSRYHAVLQYKSKSSPEKPAGFYLYDLDSTHGSFHNKNKCFPKTFYRLRVGHMLKFGMSTRTLILQGPEEDSELESDLSVTELKTLAAEKAKKKAEEKEAALKRSEEEEEGGEETENTGGVSWGMAEDAHEFPDMDQNPFAETADNERLYINDPKKALKNWFDREGYDLEYDVEEKGFAQFLCKISLPVDAPSGVNTVAEALVKGKKKEATIQAALEACRILDRLNLLNPSHQSAAEKKVKRWEEDDFYASDEDEFLDRTGSIEQKRKQRMKMAGKAEATTSVETYETLMAKHKVSESELVKCEKELKDALARKMQADVESENHDLDSYLAQLNQGAQVDKQTIQKLKVRISALHQELDKLTKLINIARPASLPELKPPHKTSDSAEKPKLSGIMIGKRGSKGLLGKVKNVQKENKTQVLIQTKDTSVLEAFLDKDDDKPKRSRPDCDSSHSDEEDDIKPIGYEARPEPKPKERIGDTSVNALNKVLGTRGPHLPDHLKAKNAGRTEEEGMELATVDAGSEEQNLADNVMNTSNSTEDHPVLRAAVDNCQGGDDVNDELVNSAVKRKRGDRGSKRKKREVEAEEEEEKDQYYKVGMDSKYDVWVPPAGQTGDGRTSLNDKLGY